MRYGALRGCLIVVFVVAITNYSDAAPQHLKDTHKVQTNNSSADSLDSHKATDSDAAHSQPPSPRIDKVLAESGDGENQKKLDKADEEGTEFLPVIQGYRVKVSDGALIGTNVLLFLATFALWWSTRRLVRDAGKTAERQLRAYVYAEQVNPRWHEKPPIYCGGAPVTQPCEIFEIEVILKNSGQTPARYAITSISHRLFDDEVPNDFDFPDVGLAAWTAFGPGTNVTSDKVIFGVAAIKASKCALVWGWVEYSDAFINTPRRRTEFCFEVRIGPVLWNGQYPINFPHFKKFNGADGDCVHKAKEYHDRIK